MWNELWWFLQSQVHTIFFCMLILKHASAMSLIFSTALYSKLVHEHSYLYLFILHPVNIIYCEWQMPDIANKNKPLRNFKPNKLLNVWCLLFKLILPRHTHFLMKANFLSDFAMDTLPLCIYELVVIVYIMIPARWYKAMFCTCLNAFLSSYIFIGNKRFNRVVCGQVLLYYSCIFHRT